MTKIIEIDERRFLTIPGDTSATITYAAEQWKKACLESVHLHGAFFVALSGGSTPKAIFEKLTQSPYREDIPWDKIHLFWSDERCVAPTDSESNYYMAMNAGLKEMTIPATQIHRMPADAPDILESAKQYELLIRNTLREHSFDLIMLGMGDDGHTASLFPYTLALQESTHYIVANHIPQKDTWRMTMTYPCINSASRIVLYVTGSTKSPVLAHVLSKNYDPLQFPSQKIGIPSHKANWIADGAAAAKVLTRD
jgi:6-phosphogluconolactonase